MFTLKKQKDKPFVILQLTDLQIIDPSQRCAPDRLRQDEIDKWQDVNKCAFNQLKKLVRMTKPDWIIHTGDQIYGEFDGKGSSFKKFVRLMESFRIPWSFVNGNHDGEIVVPWNGRDYKCGKGCEWQANYIKNHTKYCLYEQGNKKMGFGNYYIKLKEGNKTIWSFIMMDTHGARNEGIGPNSYQKRWLKRVLDNINKDKPINNFMFYHIPNYEFVLAGTKYYGDQIFTITTDGSKNERGDCGENKEKVCFFKDESFWEYLKQQGSTKAIFVGHDHINDSSIEYEGIRLTYGVKLGSYDYHDEKIQGATKITIDDGDYDVKQIFIK